MSVGVVWEGLALQRLPSWMSPVVEAARRVPRAGLAAGYAAALCRQEPGCPVEAVVAATVAFVAGDRGLLERLPRGVGGEAERLVSEAEEAYLRSPARIGAQVLLDADALSRMGVVGLLLGGSRGLGDLLQVFAEAMSWAAASDYVLYTRGARGLASRLKPHTLAAANWVAEELQALGYRLRARTETSSGGLVSYLDLLACPCGRAEKTAAVKPRRECIVYSVSYSCCGEELGFSICTPESTRLK